MKKILVIVPSLRLCNGVASYVMNYYRCFDKNKIKMDFVVIRDIPSIYYDEIRQDGNNIFIMPSPKKFYSFCKKIKEIYIQSNYDIIHCNVVNSGIPFLYYASKMGIRYRILHSHATKAGDVKWKVICGKILKPLVLANANTYFACSDMAGKYLFKDKPFKIINNALDLEKFKFNYEVREKLRTEMELQDNFVIGTVGRTAYQKNPYFALDVIKEVVKLCPKAIYIWIGSGYLDDDVKAYAQAIGISDNVRFLGNRSDVNDLYQVMDVFFLPSLYEGLPVVGVEAQAMGLPVIMADTITTETKITDNVTFISFKEAKSVWAKKIIECNNVKRMDNSQKIIDNNYEINTEARKLQDYYMELD